MSRRLGLAMLLPLLATVSVAAQDAIPVKVRTVTDTLVGAVGGVAVDRLGVIYVADFGERVYKVLPDGRTTVFATGLYGSSGNAIDSRGRLLQSNFSGNSISRITRDGVVTTFAEGLQGPVGVAVDSADNVTVTNCRGNSLSRISPDGQVRPFATSPLFNCPNGITRAPDGRFFVVNFSDAKMLEISATGEVKEFADIPGGGNGHVAQLRGSIYVTAFQTHQLYRVDQDGSVHHVAGSAQPGEVDGPGPQARFSFPNGIAAGPTGDRLYINDYLNRTPPTTEAPPIPRSILRQVTLPAFWEVLVGALQSGGVAAMEARYRSWKADPATATIFTEPEVNGLGYQLMSNGNLAAARAVLRLNTESYPNSFNTWDSHAEAEMNAGNRAEAIRLYRKSLEINPANTNAVAKLAELGVKPE